MKVLARFATEPGLPPPGTVYIGSEMHGTTLSQYGVTVFRSYASRRWPRWFMTIQIIFHWSWGLVGYP